MVMVDIDEEIYEQTKKIVENNNIEYPTIKNYINRILKDKNKKME